MQNVKHTLTEQQLLQQWLLQSMGLHSGLLCQVGLIPVWMGCASYVWQWRAGSYVLCQGITYGGDCILPRASVSNAASPVGGEEASDHRLIQNADQRGEDCQAAVFHHCGRAPRSLPLPVCSPPLLSPLIQALGCLPIPHTPCMDGLGRHKLNRAGSSNLSEHELCLAWHEPRRFERATRAP